MRFLLIVSSLITIQAYTSPIIFNLNDPTYEKGSLSTDSGGVIQGDNFRVQAQTIRYTHKDSAGTLLHTVEASGDLMVEYESRTFIGKEFFYDFSAKSGYLIEGKASDGLWYVGGQKLLFLPTRTVEVQNAFVTCSDDNNPTWDFHAKELSLTKDKDLKAHGVTFRSAGVPIMYVPYYSTNLKKKSDSPFTYSANWDTGPGQGPKISLRYRVYETDTFDLFARLDYRIARGGGGAIETDYASLDRKVKIQTKSYLAHDTFAQDPNPRLYKTRYRLQGLAEGKQLGEKMDIFLRYDYISDKYMPSDLPSPEFELATAKRTELVVNRTDQNLVTNLYIRPKINNWQGFKQEIPTFRIMLKPLSIPGINAIMENTFKVAYLDYQYSTDMELPLNQSPPSSFKAGRLQTTQSIYRSFQIPYITLTPSIGYNGIYYTNNPSDQATGFSQYQMGLEASSFFYNNFPGFTHHLKPYASAQWIFTTNQLSNHFIFSLEDGFTDLRYMRIGLKNSFFSSKIDLAYPLADIDIYTYGFFHQNNLPSTFPFGYLEGNLSWPRASLSSLVKIDTQNGRVARYNQTWKWTVSNSVAFSAEFRYRSKYDIRKCDPTNFFVDVAYPFNEEINSPLVDPRNTFLLKAQVNLTPFTSCRVQTQVGWNRPQQPPYTESRVDLFTMVSTLWKLRVSYQHSVYDDQVSMGLSMIPYRK